MKGTLIQKSIVHIITVVFIGVISLYYLSNPIHAQETVLEVNINIEETLTIKRNEKIITISNQNTSSFHSQTDTPRFWFNKPLSIDDVIESYNSNNLVLRTSATDHLPILNSNGHGGIRIDHSRKEMIIC